MRPGAPSGIPPRFGPPTGGMPMMPPGLPPGMPPSGKNLVHVVLSIDTQNGFDYCILLT